MMSDVEPPGDGSRIMAAPRIVGWVSTLLWLRLMVNLIMGSGAVWVATTVAGTVLLCVGVTACTVYGYTRVWVAAVTATALMLPIATWSGLSCGDPADSIAAAARDLAYPILNVALAARYDIGKRVPAAARWTAAAAAFEVLLIACLGWSSARSKCGASDHIDATLATHGGSSVTVSVLSGVLLFAIHACVQFVVDRPHAALTASPIESSMICSPPTEPTLVFGVTSPAVTVTSAPAGGRSSPIPEHDIVSKASVMSGPPMTFPIDSPHSIEPMSTDCLSMTSASRSAAQSVTSAPPAWVRVAGRPSTEMLSDLPPPDGLGTPVEQQVVVRERLRPPPILHPEQMAGEGGHGGGSSHIHNTSHGRRSAAPLPPSSDGGGDVVMDATQEVQLFEEYQIPLADAPTEVTDLDSIITHHKAITVEDAMLFYQTPLRVPETTMFRVRNPLDSPSRRRHGRRRVSLMDGHDPTATPITTMSMRTTSTAAVHGRASWQHSPEGVLTVTDAPPSPLVGPGVSQQTSMRRGPGLRLSPMHSAIPRVLSSRLLHAGLVVSDTTSPRHQVERIEGKSKRSFANEVRVLWKALDKADTGMLDSIAVQDLLDILGVGFADDDYHEFMDAVDIAGNVDRETFIEAFEAFRLAGLLVGHYSRIRLAAIASAFNGGTVQSRVVRTWGDFDEDGDGTLDSHEIVPILVTLGLPHEPADILELFQEFDANIDPQHTADRIEYNDFISIFSYQKHEALAKTTTFAARMREASQVLEHANEWSGRAAASQRYCTEDQTRATRRRRRRQRLNAYVGIVFLYATITFASSLFRIVFDARLDVAWATIICLSDVILWSWLFVKHRLAPKADGMFFMRNVANGLPEFLTIELLLDILIVLPVDWVGLGVEGVSYAPLWRVNKCLLMFHTPKLFHATTRKLSPMPVRITAALSVLLMQAHLLACLFKLTADHEGDEMVMAITTLGKNNSTMFSELPLTLQYSHSFDYALKTMTGWGRGDPIPAGDLHVLQAAFIVITGVASYAYVLAAISNALQIPSVENQFKEKMEEVKGFCEYINIDPELKASCLAYYKHTYRTSSGLSGDAFLEDLPHELAIICRLVQTQQMLAKVPIFADSACNDDFVYALSLKLRPGVLCPGELVTEQGTPGSTMYFIIHGECCILSDIEEEVYALKRGDFFGEIALLHNVRRTATIRARTFCNVLVLEKSDFEEVCEVFPEALAAIYTAAEERIRVIVREERRQQWRVAGRLALKASATVASLSSAVNLSHLRNGDGESGTNPPPDDGERPSSSHSIGARSVTSWLDQNRTNVAREVRHTQHVLGKIKARQRAPMTPPPDLYSPNDEDDSMDQL